MEKHKKIILKTRNCSTHKLKILLALNLNQWTILPQQQFPLLSNKKDATITFYKNITAIKLQFAAIDPDSNNTQKDTPITFYKISQTPQLNFKPLLTVTPKKIFFDNQYEHLYSKILKLSNISVNLADGSYHLTIKQSSLDTHTFLRDAIAKFVEKHDRLPCHNDLIYMKSHKHLYYQHHNNQKKAPSLIHSGNLNRAVVAGYLQKIQELTFDANNYPCNRTLYKPLYPELHPGQEVHNYYRGEAKYT